MRRRHAIAHRFYRSEGDTSLIEIRLREPRQLLSTLDPAPFREKDLDPAAEAYITEAVREIGPKQRVRIVLYLPAAQLAHGEATALPAAISNYYAYRAELAAHELADLRRRGLVSLCIGLAFLFACLALRRFVGGLPAGAVPEILDEGLLIMGWVAMWRPIEIFLFDWWPIRRRLLRLRHIAGLPVEVRAEPAGS